MPSSTEVRRHPWNERFDWSDCRGPFAEISDDQARQYNEDGFIVIPDLVPSAELAEIRDEIDAAESATEAFLESLPDGRISIAESGAITFSLHLVTRSERLRALSAHPRIAGLCADLIGPDVRLYWDQAVYKKPEKPRRFPWHQDNGYTYIDPQQYLTVWLALTDATVENGCPWVTPGLHREGTLEHHYVEPLGWECLTDPAGAVAAPVPAGGAVVFSSLTPHLTGPNTSGETRKAYILQYAPDGAEVLRGDPGSGPPTGREPAMAPDRQYPILSGGRPVGPPPLRDAASGS